MVERPVEVDPVGEVGLFEPGEDAAAPGEAPLGAALARLPPLGAADGKPAARQEVAVESAAHVPEIVGTGDPPGRLAGRLRGGQEQADETGDHEHHDEQLHERHAGSMSACGWMSGGHARTCGLGAHRPRKGPAAARHHESSLSGKRNERPPHA